MDGSGLGNDMGTMNGGNVFSVTDAARRVLEDERDNYRTKRLWREAARYRCGRPVTTGDSLAKWSSIIFG